MIQSPATYSHPSLTFHSTFSSFSCSGHKMLSDQAQFGAEFCSLRRFFAAKNYWGMTASASTTTAGPTLSNWCRYFFSFHRHQNFLRILYAWNVLYLCTWQYFKEILSFLKPVSNLFHPKLNNLVSILKEKIVICNLGQSRGPFPVYTWLRRQREREKRSIWLDFYHITLWPSGN